MNHGGFMFQNYSWIQASKLRSTLAVVGLVSGTLVFGNLTPAYASQEGDSHPEIVSTWISKTEVDVVDGSQEVTVRIEVRDPDYGLSDTSPRLDPDPLIVNRVDNSDGDPVQGQQLKLIGGDAFQGTYEGVFTFTENIYDGEWCFQPTIADRMGNRFDAYEHGQSEWGIGLCLIVTSVPDMEAPVVSGALSSSIIDVTDDGATLDLRIEAEDDGVGLKEGTYPSLTSESGNSSHGWKIVSSSKNQKRRTFVRTLKFSKYDSASSRLGTFNVAVKGISDANGNRSKYDSIGSYTLGIRPLRGKKPILESGSQGVTVSWVSHPNSLENLEYEVELIDSSAIQRASYKTHDTVLVTNEVPSGTYTARVRARNVLGWGEWTSASDPIGHTANVKSSIPRVLGAPTVGHSLTAVPGSWGPDGVELSYQWAANGINIGGATQNTFPLTPDLVGKNITVTVTGRLNGYAMTSKTSVATGKVAAGALSAAIPKATGTPTVGHSLTAVPGSWGPDGVELSYQWAANGINIGGATQNTFPLTPDLVGKNITVTVTGRLNGYAMTSKTSVATGKVAPQLVQTTAPTSDLALGRLTIPSVTGVRYLVDGIEKKPGTYTTGYKRVSIVAHATEGYSLSGTAAWVFDLSKTKVVAKKPTVNYSTHTLNIPNLPGVQYTVDGITKNPGTYNISTQIVVKAEASAANYDVAPVTWKYDLRTTVSATKPVFDAKKNTVKIPAKTGVTYYVNGAKKSAGTYKYTGAGTVTVNASSGGYKLTGTTSWKFDNRNVVAATKPVFDAKKNTVKIPAKTGVTYYVNGVKKSAGTYKYTGKVNVIAKPSSDAFRIKGTSSWSAKL
ncbi:fibronectin type III domain-containing protein [Arthrobacter sp. YC-RL1]|uniref:fibronectin type III domain-containing protein n=1 Tax=Arthrobacter sp. YC-RL1 TaxID=1652545 RepID=UPI000A9D178B|nr:fibronectin type III domain-containing protein [Arthrobacter sp. YC-RL1]